LWDRVSISLKLISDNIIAVYRIKDLLKKLLEVGEMTKVLEDLKNSLKNN